MQITLPVADVYLLTTAWCNQMMAVVLLNDFFFNTNRCVYSATIRDNIAVYSPHLPNCSFICRFV